MPFSKYRGARRLNISRALSPTLGIFRIHPLFLVAGVWYACTGELFLFLISALVAVQHECAHAFAGAALGYKLNAIVLMPYGAIIDGDLKNITLKDESFVALSGPLCNLATAVFFAALWWFFPATYPYTDSACFTSLAVGLVNLLPAYPLDGGRILKCALVAAFLKAAPEEGRAEKKAKRVCRAITLLLSGVLLLFFLLLCARRTFNFSLLAFSVFLAVGAFGNRDECAVYQKLDLSAKDALTKGVELKRVAVLEGCTLKKAMRFLSSSRYLVLEVYDESEAPLFTLPQNELAALLLRADSPYETLGELYRKL